MPGKNSAQGRILCTDLAHLAFTPIFSALLCPAAKMLDLGVKLHYTQITFNSLQKKPQNPAPHQQYEYEQASFFCM